MKRLRYQNLNENRLGNIQGSAFWKGRCWWGSWGLEWCFGRHSLGSLSIGIDFNHGDSNRGLALHCCIPLLWRLYLHTERFIRIPVKGERWDPGRSVAFKIHDGAIWIQPWCKEMSWTSTDPWWVRGVTIHPMDVLFGRQKYSERTEREITSAVPMPEGSYACEIRFFTATWKRSRWLVPTNRLRAEIKMCEPIPFPGKGESSWDCDDDALHGQTCSATSEWEAIGSVVESVLRSRCLYGSGVNWRAAAK